jgi:hypothetical protein
VALLALFCCPEKRLYTQGSRAKIIINMKTRPSRFLGCFVLWLLSLVLCARPLAAEDHSYVRSYTPKKVTLKGGAVANGLIINLIDTDLPGILAAPKYAAVDVVMNQCYSGGFLAALTASKPANDWTGACACKEDETSYYLFSVEPPKTDGPADDFTRAWREDALRTPPTGMKRHFDTALDGDAGANILGDRYAPGQTIVHQVVLLHRQIGNYTELDPMTMQPVNKFGPKPGTDNTTHPYDAFQGEIGGVKGWWIKPLMVPGTQMDPNTDWIQVTPKPGPGPGGKWVINGKEYDYVARYPFETEHPQYATAGNESNQRTLALPDPNTNNVQQYAILVQWDEPKKDRTEKTAAFAADISRMYNMLTNSINGVPANHIAVLYYDGNYADANPRLPAFKLQPGVNGAKTEDLPEVPINAPTGVDADGKQQFADNAVNGKLFGAIPDFAKSRLLVHFTGHGGRTKLKKAAVGYDPDPNLIVTLLSDKATDTGGNLVLSGYDAAAEFEQNMLSSLATTNSDDLSLAAILYNTNNILDAVQDSQALIQISTTQLIPYGVQLVVNDYTNPVSLQPVTDPSATVYDLDPFVPGLLTNTYTYQVLVPNLRLINSASNGANPLVIGLQFQGLPVTNFEPGFVAAVILRGAAQELAYTTPDFTSTTRLAAQNFGSGILVTWPPSATNYNILQNDDLNTTNWLPVIGPVTLLPEVTGVADPTLPMGTNWAFFSYSGSQRFFKLAPAP